MGMIIRASTMPAVSSPFARSDRVPEVPQHRHVGHVVGDDGIDVAGQNRPEGEQAPQADDHTGDAGQHLDGEARAAARSSVGRRSVRAKAAPIEIGTAMITAMAEVCRVPTISGQRPVGSTLGVGHPVGVDGGAVAAADRSSAVPVKKLQPLTLMAGMALMNNTVRAKTSAASGRSDGDAGPRPATCRSSRRCEPRRGSWTRTPTSGASSAA